jgi:arabinofuranosyltransferase
VKGKEAAFLLTLFLGVYFILVLRTAWVGDDAYLTFRVVSNFVHGLGLRWNVSERVEIFTHPLWTFLISAAYALSKDVYYTCLLISLICSLAAALILTRGIARSAELGLLSVSLLSLSKAYVDYSTSGLENPLTNLLLALFLLYLFRGASLRVLAAIAGLLTLNRMDSLILVLPVLLVLAFRRRQALRALAVGFLPFFLWTLFSIVYYGFPFPNSAYAKLATGIPENELLSQGFIYLLNSLSLDPLTLFATLTGLGLGVAYRVPFARALGFGVLLYLFYTVSVGGDFMSGRFLTGPFLLSVALMARLPVDLRGSQLALALAIFLLLGLPSLRAGLTGPPPVRDSSLIDRNGISDERLFYAPTSGLLGIRRGVITPASQSAAEGRWARIRGRTVVVGGNGMSGFFAGPSVHFIDVSALGDPFLARLPAKRGWRIGHFLRAIPAGYVGELKGKPGGIGDPSLAAYLDRLRLVTSGNLFTWERWRAIYDLNLGAGRHLLDAYCRLHSRMQRVALDAVSEPRSDGWDAARGCVAFSDHGISVALERVAHEAELQLSLENNETYSIEGLNEGQLVWQKKIPVRLPGSENLAVHELRLEPALARTGYDEVQIFPEEGEDEYALGHLVLVASASPQAEP